MPRAAQFTREDIIRAALELTRVRGIDAVVARELGKALGVSSSPIFTVFQSMDEVREAVVEQAKKMYDGYVREGLAMNPPFKGFAMQYLRFAREEPRLFELLFVRMIRGQTFEQMLGEEGHHELICRVVTETFHISEKEAEWLYSNIWIYVHGIAMLQISDVYTFDEKTLAEMIGSVVRGLLMELRSPEDERVRLVPVEGQRIVGDVIKYAEAKYE